MKALKNMFSPRLTVSLALALLSLSGLAQIHSTTTVIQTPGGPIYNTFYWGAPDVQFFRKNNIKGKPSINDLNFYNVKFIDDTLLKVHTKINLNQQPHCLKVNYRRIKMTIYPSQTEYIAKLYDDGSQAVGIAADSLWLFKTISGKITVFSSVPESYWEFVVALQKGEEGPLVPFTRETLTEMVADKQRAAQLASEGDYQSAVMYYNFGKEALGPDFKE